jgi:hypothetical protein
VRAAGIRSAMVRAVSGTISRSTPCAHQRRHLDRAENSVRCRSGACPACRPPALPARRARCYLTASSCVAIVSTSSEMGRASANPISLTRRQARLRVQWRPSAMQRWCWSCPPAG